MNDIMEGARQVLNHIEIAGCHLDRLRINSHLSGCATSRVGDTTPLPFGGQPLGFQNLVLVMAVASAFALAL
jgi:hypothetical protein